MNIIHVLAADGTHAPYDEEEIRHLLGQGEISPDTLYWKPGMDEWRPLAELPPIEESQPPEENVPEAEWLPPIEPPEEPRDPNPIEPQPLLGHAHPVDAPEPVEAFPPVPEPMIASAQPAGYLLNKPMGVLTGIVLFMLTVCLLADIFGFLFFYAYLDVLTGPTPTQDDIHHAAQVAVGGLILSLAAKLLTAIPFLIWISRAYSNCQNWAGDMRFSSGWAVGYYFIPIVCLFRPCQVMQEIWRVSTNPARWKRVDSSILVGVWWTLWLLALLMGNFISIEARDVHEIYDLISLTQLHLLMLSFEILLCVFAALVVYQIYRKQKRLLSR